MNAESFFFIGIVLNVVLDGHLNRAPTILCLTWLHIALRVRPLVVKVGKMNF